MSNPKLLKCVVTVEPACGLRFPSKVCIAAIRIVIQNIKYLEKVMVVSILIATVFSIGKEFQAMYIAMTVTLADLLLLFIYLEVIQMAREYWTLDRIRISIPLFIAITAVARLIILQGKTMDPSMLLYEGGAILLIAIAVLILKARKLKMFSDVDD